MTVLSFNAVTVTARMQRQPVDLLRDISFSLNKGDVIGLVGESGAGKSMIGRVISGLLPDNFSVSSGEVIFEGLNLLNLSKSARRDLLGRRIAFIPQEPLSALNPVRSIGDQFQEHLKHLGVAKDVLRSLMIERLQQVGLSNAEEMLLRYPHELSGGQCQRVLIAMAFSGEPALVVADEPTTALDVVTQAQIMRLIAAQQAQHGTAVLFITHDLRLAANVCRTVGVMYAGDMVEFGPAEAVLQAPSHPYTKSLLAAIPRLTGERRMLPTLSEQMPGLKMFSTLAGCRFAQRCPAKDAACVSARLERRFVSENHWTRCGDTCGDFEFASGAPILVEPLAASAQKPAVEFQNVRLEYKARRGFLGLRKTSFDAVRSASFTVRPGEILGIVGESGSGKSSIGRLIVGLEKSTEGTIKIAGEERGALGNTLHLTRRDTQLIFQDPQSALNPRRSVLQLLTQGLEVGPNSLPVEKRRAAADNILQDIGLPADCLTRFPSQLSGGQRQRVNIGRALCLEPKLVVADEIVSGLDVSVQAHILNCLLELNRQKNLTMVFISHDLGVVRYLCSRILMMYRGEIVEEGVTEEVFARPKHPYTKLLMESVPS
ncbi:MULTISPECIES: ABC transporter ATP-binding protein [unclassified Beijerinckia]|uniref:dipeptide ABC transporter ATP-binding protein n=1 Tax=unclassified Beijerinckia TaxID=2638183 RepID=UPI00089D4187|nr:MULTISPECIES: ABC transporter ATP-binding protein [unclassified Beijerinckia]MDH7799537.1 peptide/nickel transport system ATP-binding protein [Beijerinckia sp. GAS462]SEB46228.1 peptide/nickel transport system ATP-binding protein [Beijerinckia sp. 28-YEA-48]